MRFVTIWFIGLNFPKWAPTTHRRAEPPAVDFIKGACIDFRQILLVCDAEGGKNMEREKLPARSLINISRQVPCITESHTIHIHSTRPFTRRR